MLTLEDLFPPYQLQIRCGDVEMRVLRDDDIPEIVELIRSGITDASLPMPFLADWHALPFQLGVVDQQPAHSLSWWWQQRATVAADNWKLPLIVRRGGVAVGMQDVMAEDFPQRRSIESGSWLASKWHGQGIGTRMRQMMVALAFDELDALECRSGYIEGNAASAAVSRKTGYVDVGARRIVQRNGGELVGGIEHEVCVTPATFIRPTEPIEISGADALRRFFKIERF
ncbi:GNAT family N-acetyltransferase [Gulosibacter hominis]|uniref:GNAT family N-acetyltransferase n=1 Tax=Gulosibacter hominis TaxID=2770504 RepID=UPI001919E35B|nr:GNAT family protein [Gulosibacter hominis]